jgi:hypothetical protein
MATHDVPGAKASNNDKLHGQCWAEHEDGSMLFVLSTEDQRVIYELFDLSKTDEPVCYRDAMPIGDFYKAFSWDDKTMIAETNGKRFNKEKWLWHDKTPFPWDRVIDNKLLKKGVVAISAQHTLSAAARIAESLKLRREALDTEQFRERMVRGLSVVSAMKDKLARAFNELVK